MFHNLKRTQEYAWSLAKTLMVCVVVFQIEGQYSVMIADEYDGDEASIVNEFDPF